MVDAMRGCVPAVVWVKMLQATITAYATAVYRMIFWSALCLLQVACKPSHDRSALLMVFDSFDAWDWTCWTCATCMQRR